MPNQGNEWSYSEETRYTNFGMFGHLRPMGKAPRGMNLWEADWGRIWKCFTEQFSPKGATVAHFEQWWIRSNVDRAGGWDRLMRPGPGMPTVAEVARGVPRPCVLQQIVRLRQGARDDYLAWFGAKAAPAAARVGWKAVAWMGAVHSSLAVTLIAAPDWSRFVELGRALPQPDPAWEADVDSHAMQGWAQSNYLKRK